MYDEDGDESEEITWCEDRVNDSDVEYIIAPKKQHSKKLELIPYRDCDLTL